MPETYGKRQRGNVKAKKAAAREERRLARNQRKANREAGLPEDWLAPPEVEDDSAPQAQTSDTEEQTQTDEQTQTESTP